MSATWPSYEHVNVQVAVDAWLADGAGDGGRGHEVYGITGIGFMTQMEVVGIGDFLQGRNEGPFSSAGVGGVMTMAVPSGPDGQTYACVEQREAYPGEQPQLFQLLNEMDGLGSAADVTFLLTTNRADLLEPASTPATSSPACSSAESRRNS